MTQRPPTQPTTAQPPSRRGRPRRTDGRASRPSRVALGGVAVAVTAAVLTLSATAASAHAHADAVSVGPDGATVIEISFEHGCEGGQPTTALRVRAPEGATDLAAVDQEGWSATVTEDQVTWTGGSVPDGEAAVFTFSAKLAQPDGAKVTVPVVQECPDGEAAWIGPPEVEGAETEAENPAPVIVVPAGGGEQATPAGETTTSAADDPAASTTTVEGTAGEDADASSGTAAPAGGVTATRADDGEGTGPGAGGTTGLVILGVIVLVVAGGATLLIVRSRRATAEVR